ncbi:MAG TPA: adenylate/guanylate cyclase domain-containing protein [Rectinemataceae bacterium]|nr:adenylate/guanylate cyclase domain-containing protein [Rectinemataceae bacterium]
MSGLSIATPTFLFTDMEASSLKWERDAQAMSGALRRHDEILREGIESRGGLVFKTVGDAFCAAFSDPVQALRAAVAIQLAIASEKWGLPGVAVRMALHSGPAEERDGDYFGQTLNRASRILGLAYGGQILLSLATSELLADHVPEGISLRSLGSHRLKDLSRAESISQAGYEGLREDFPPLRSIDSRPHNLPVEPTAFIDRVEAIDTIKTSFTDPGCRFLSILGAGGVGKSRLSVQAGAELIDAFEGGVWFVELAACRDAEEAAGAIASVLAVKEEASQGPQKALVAHLASRQVLLVLDNLEQVSGAGGLLAELLAACPSLSIMATSREALRIRWERQFSLEPLSLPRGGDRGMASIAQCDAVRLFVERAKAVRPSFLVDEANAPAIAQICARLDGIPLAIELAASRIRAFPAEEIMRRLEVDFAFLDCGSRDLPDRQRTLRSVADWSYKLLSRPERAAFRALGAFRGSFSLASAEALLAAAGKSIGAQAPELLASLVDKSLLVFEEGDDHSHYHLLETLRVYAAELLSRSPESEAVEEAHSRRYHELAMGGRGEDPGRIPEARYSQGLRLEHAEFIRALDSLLLEEDATRALELACGFWKHWDMQGAYSEGIRYFDRCLEENRGLSLRLTIVGLRDRGALKRSSGDYERAALDFEKSIELARSGGLEKELASGLVAMGWNDYYRGRRRQSHADFAGARGLALGLGDGLVEAEAAQGLGSLALVNGELDEAIGELEKALSAFEGRAEMISAARVATNLAVAYVRKGRRADACRLFERSEAFFRVVGDRECAMLALNNLACFDFEDFCLDKALSRFDLVEAEARALGSPKNIALALIGRADTLNALGEAARALAASEEALSIASRHSLDDEAGMARKARGAAFAALGRVEEAREDLEAAIAALELVGNAAELAKARELAARLGEYPEKEEKEDMK